MLNKKRKSSEPNYRETERYYVNYLDGLSSKQVERRKNSGLTNKLINNSFKSVKDIIIENTFTYFNLIFLVLSVLLCVVQSYKNLSFLPIIVVNTLIGIIQEIKAKRTLDKLNMINTPHSLVVREGIAQQVDVEELVLDDIVIFKSGDQITADATVVNGEVYVNESLLTGESNEIKKDKENLLLSGSFVTSGECYARLDHVGNSSYISKLTEEAKGMNSEEQSQMILSINKLVKWIGIIIIPIGLTLFIQSYFFSGHSFKESIISMEAALIGMIPEGLYLLTTLALTLSVARLAKKKVLVHNMKSIETLARVDVLCVDKTGTITENNMAVTKFFDAHSFKVLDKKSGMYQLISSFCYNMPKENSTMEAFKKYFGDKNLEKADSITSFSSVEKFSSARFGEITYILGAPEMVLRSNVNQYIDRINQYSDEGYRVLVFGKYEGQLKKREIVNKVVPLCFILLSNPIRKEASKTFKYFNKQNVNIKVISGDNPRTVLKVAKEAGITQNNNFIDATTLSTDKEIIRALRNNSIFGRVTPEQKKRFVELLKADGKTVAMTGDGVNDILAMKVSDCSIAMASGNKATTQASQVVLLESDFSKMPSVVEEGRQVVNNIERSASLFLVKNMFSLLVSLFSIALAISYPLEPSQISLIGLITIGMPSFLLALENNSNLIKGNFSKNILTKALPGAATDILSLMLLMSIGMLFNPPKSELSTVATILLIYIGFLQLVKISVPFNRYRIKIIGCCLFVLAMMTVLFSGLFSLSPLSVLSMVFLIIFIITATLIFKLIDKLVYKFI